MRSPGVRLVILSCGVMSRDLPTTFHRRAPHLFSISSHFFSSKTPINSSLGLRSTPTSDPGAGPFPYQLPSSQKFPLVSQTATAPSSERRVFIRKRKEILKIEEEELVKYPGLLKRKYLPLIDIRGEASNVTLRSFDPDSKRSWTDFYSFFHGDWDFRAENIRRWWSSVDTEFQIRQQEYNPKRNKVLGNDLATAHFVVFRKGRVRFRGHADWITEYRKDVKPGVDEEDLPVMQFELCTLPVNYDPRFRLEAVDFSGFPLRYEGLANFQNLNYVKWLSFKNSPHLDDWCMDRITRMFYETLEYIDLSGCVGISERGIGALSKCKNLKTLVVENLPQAKHLEMVAAMLEDQLPELLVIGVDYAKKAEQLRIEGEEVENKLLQAATALEANTINVEPREVPSDPSR